MNTERLRPSLRAPVAVIVATLVLSADSASAQDATRFEIRPFVGAFIPIGAQRDLLDDAVLTGAGLSWQPVPALSVTGTFAWSPSKDAVTPNKEKLDIYQYDLGAELRAASWYRAARWDFTPFVGAGLGARTYDYRNLDASSTTNVAGFAELGGDIGFGPVGIRFAARNYVSRFKPLIGDGDSKTRNDIGLVLGLGYRF